MLAAPSDDGWERRTVAILAADLCGYTRLVARDEAGTLSRLLADRRLIAELAAARGGRVFNTAGDAMLAEFGTAAAALLAAIAFQQRIEGRSRSEAPARRMRYRLAVTVGEVVQDGGDLLGDAVNLAARLEKLAEPGGICLSRAARDAAGGAVPPATRDIGAQRLKNVPQPVFACLVAPQAIGGMPAGRRWPSVAATVAGLALVAGAAAALSAGRAGPDGFVFPPDAAPPVEARPAPRGPVSAAAVPFVGDADRGAIAGALAADPGSAVAITRGGTIGVAASGGDPERAGGEALRRCFAAGGLNCRLYAVGGEVVWPDPTPPMPPEPWTDPSAPRTPFSADRIAGLRPDQARRLAQEYPRAEGHKALALGPRGIWHFYKHKGDAREAERLALQSCGDATGTPCRIVAVDGDFVVPLRGR